MAHSLRLIKTQLEKDITHCGTDTALIGYKEALKYALHLIKDEMERKYKPNQLK